MDEIKKLCYMKRGYGYLYYNFNAGIWKSKTFDAKTEKVQNNVLLQNRMVNCDVVFEDETLLTNVTLFKDHHNNIVLRILGGTFLMTTDYGGSILIKHKQRHHYKKKIIKR